MAYTVFSPETLIVFRLHILLSVMTSAANTPITIGRINEPFVLCIP